MMKSADLKRGKTYRYKGHGASGYGIFRGELGQGRHKQLAFERLDGTFLTKPLGMAIFPELHFGKAKTWRSLAGHKLSLEEQDHHELKANLPGLVLPRSCFSCYMGAQQEIRLTNKMEVWFVAQLEQHNIYWDFEPDTFHFESGKTYLPDFYIPELDLYVELTMSKRKAKRTKLSALRCQFGEDITCIHQGNVRQFRDLCHKKPSGDAVIEWLSAARENSKINRKVAQ